ncbi:MAG: PTS fructose transporter subunit IIA [Chromatiaceae bacterium]|jgi:PTS system ascorbate-specific IIA component|nr:PTS fructose transporter subunit IIA [Chromatiaceae bacterium]
MSVGLLIVTHNTIGSALLETATKMLGACPLRAETLEITEYMEPDLLLGQARAMAAALDSGDGVLVLTDLYGSTPANIARALAGEHVRVLAGVNLPMLVRVLNYAALPLSELVDKGLSGGRDGILCAADAGGAR